MKIKKRVTIEDVLSLNPCSEYTRERIAGLFGKQTHLTLADLDEIDIPISDKLWLLLHEEFIPADKLHLLACRFAERALRRERRAGREPDAGSWAAIKARRDWIKGGISDGQLDMTRATASAAAREAAWIAADGAASDEEVKHQYEMALEAAKEKQ